MASTAKAQIVLDTSTTRAVAASSANWTHVSRSGSNSVLIVTVVINSGSITSCLFDGTAMTLFGSDTRNNMVASMYYMVSPPTGSLTVSVNVSGGSTNIRAGAATYFNVNQSVPLQDLMTTDNSSANPSVTYYSDPGLALVLLGSRSNPTPVSTVQVYERGLNQFNNLSTTATLGSASLIYSMASSDWVMVAGLMNPLVGLPVTFGELKAKKQRDVVALNWKMYDLKDVQNIYVERSLDGHNFVKVGIIDPPAASSSVDFSFDDKDAPLQRLFYRIATSDKHGKTEYSPVSSINNSESGSQVTVYPNPGTDIVHIQSGAAIRKASLLNLSGQTLMIEGNTGSNVSQMDISKLQKGIYFLHIEDVDGNIIKEKIQKI